MKLFTQGKHTHDITHFTFPAGELQVQLKGPELRGDINLFAQIQSAESLVKLMLAGELINRLHAWETGRRTLTLPYFPYARQDRIMVEREAFSLRVSANLINDLPFDEIITYDVHSNVTPALIPRLRNISQVEIIKKFNDFHQILRAPIKPIIVSPDAGAEKKSFEVAKEFCLDFTTSSKVRNVKTGEITNTLLHNPEKIEGRNVVIVDDICDGGRTFVELAKVLRQNRAEHIYLYVTHGIFSTGIAPLVEFDAVYTTDSFDFGWYIRKLPWPVFVHQLGV